MRVLVLDAGERNAEEKDALYRVIRNHFDADINCIRLPARNIFIRGIFCVFQSIRVLPVVHKYDAVLATSTLTGVTLSVIKSLFRPLVRPSIIIIDIALFRILDPSSPQKARIIRLLFQVANRIVCYSRRQQRMWDHIGFAGRTGFIPLGINPDKVVPATRSSENYIVSAGRAGRDLHILYEIAGKIDIPILIITGKDPIGKNRSNLVGEIPTTIQFRSDIPFSEYSDLIQRSAFVVLPLVDTSYPLGQTVLLDCMAMGKAVIATKTAGTEDYIEDGITGLFVAPGDRDDLLEKISLLLDNPQEIARLGRYAQKKIEEEFNIENMVRELANVLKATINKTP